MCGKKTGERNVQRNGNAKEPFLGGRVLRAIVDLLPECEVVVRASVHLVLEGDARHAVEHDVRELRIRMRVRTVVSAQQLGHSKARKGVRSGSAVSQSVSQQEWWTWWEERDVRRCRGGLWMSS